MSMNITTCNLCRKIFFVISAGERGYSKKKKKKERKEGRKKLNKKLLTSGKLIAFKARSWKLCAP